MPNPIGNHNHCLANTYLCIFISAGILGRSGNGNLLLTYNKSFLKPLLNVSGHTHPAREGGGNITHTHPGYNLELVFSMDFFLSYSGQKWVMELNVL